MLSTVGREEKADSWKMGNSSLIWKNKQDPKGHRAGEQSVTELHPL